MHAYGSYINLLKSCSLEANWLQARSYEYQFGATEVLGACVHGELMAFPTRGGVWEGYAARFFLNFAVRNCAF